MGDNRIERREHSRVNRAGNREQRADKIENKAKRRSHVSAARHKVPGLLGKLIGEVHGATSVPVVQSQAMCLLERLSHLAPGAKL